MVVHRFGRLNFFLHYRGTITNHHTAPIIANDFVVAYCVLLLYACPSSFPPARCALDFVVVLVVVATLPLVSDPNSTGSLVRGTRRSLCAFPLLPLQPFHVAVCFCVYVSV